MSSMRAIWELGWPLPVAAFTWIVAHLIVQFLLQPMRRFFTLKEEVLRHMAHIESGGKRASDPDRNNSGIIMITDPARQKANEERLEKARELYLNLAAQLRAFAFSETLAVRILRLMRYDPLKASSGLYGLSESIGKNDDAWFFHMTTAEEGLGVASE